METHPEAAETAPAPSPLPPDDLVVDLRRAVEFAGITYDKLALREPTADEWAQWDGKAGVEADIVAVSIVAGVPAGAVRKIGASDLLKASRYIAGFLA